MEKMEGGGEVGAGKGGGDTAVCSAFDDVGRGRSTAYFVKRGLERW